MPLSFLCGHPLELGRMFPIDPTAHERLDERVLVTNTSTHFLVPYDSDLQSYHSVITKTGLTCCTRLGASTALTVLIKLADRGCHSMDKQADKQAKLATADLIVECSSSH